MKAAAIAFSVLAGALWAGAQVAALAATRAQATATPAPQRAPEGVGPLVTCLQETAQTMNLDLSRLRIEKWKADAGVKRQSQANVDSIARNLTAGFPAMLEEARTNPGSLAAAFKLYRNLDATPTNPSLSN
jgi:hypothetical protein